MRKTGTTMTWMSSLSPDQKSEHVPFPPLIPCFMIFLLPYFLSLSPFHLRLFPPRSRLLLPWILAVA